jgi:hypothetical protein
VGTLNQPCRGEVTRLLFVTLNRNLQRDRFVHWRELMFTLKSMTHLRACLSLDGVLHASKGMFSCLLSPRVLHVYTHWPRNQTSERRAVSYIDPATTACFSGSIPGPSVLMLSPPKKANLHHGLWFSIWSVYACFYACFYDTSMGHYTGYLVTCMELSPWTTIDDIMVDHNRAADHDCLVR